MRLILAIDCNGAAFADDPATEAARIVREAAALIDYTADLAGLHGRRLVDANGNTAGRITVEG